MGGKGQILSHKNEAHKRRNQNNNAGQRIETKTLTVIVTFAVKLAVEQSNMSSTAQLLLENGSLFDHFRYYVTLSVELYIRTLLSSHEAD